MPTTNSRNLTLNREGANVRVTVTYNAVFSPFERALVGLGMTFREQIAIIGVDTVAPTNTVLGNFLVQTIPVTAGAGTLTVPRRREVVVTRATLDEDPSSLLVGPDFDADEIRCRIRIQAVGLPPAVTPDEFTDQEVLGLILQPINAAAASASD